MANRTQKPNLEAEGQEAGTGTVESAVATTLKKAQKALSRAEDGETVDVAGMQAAKPEQAYKNLEEALKYVKAYFGKTLKINLNEISFQKFTGNIAGESRENGVFISPLLLLHPAIRLAHVIAHELAHDKKKIMNEGLVESYVHAFFGEDGTEHTYDEATAKFAEFAAKCTGKRDVNETTKKIYEFYYAGKFAKIYEMFEKDYLSKVKTDTEKDDAFKLFRTVFPELKYVSDEEEDGNFGLNKPKKV